MKTHTLVIFFKEETVIDSWWIGELCYARKLIRYLESDMLYFSSTFEQVSAYSVDVCYFPAQELYFCIDCACTTKMVRVFWK